MIQGQFESIQRQILEFIDRIYQIDPLEAISTESVCKTTEPSSSTIPMQAFAKEIDVGTSTIPFYEDNLTLDSEVTELIADVPFEPPNLSSLPITWADVAAGRRSPAVFIPKEYQEVHSTSSEHAQPPATHAGLNLPSTTTQMSKPDVFHDNNREYHPPPAHTAESSKEKSHFSYAFDKGKIHSETKPFGHSYRGKEKASFSRSFVSSNQRAQGGDSYSNRRIRPYSRGRGSRPKEFAETNQFERNDKFRGRRGIAGVGRGDFGRRFYSRGTTHSRDDHRGNATPTYKESPVHSPKPTSTGRRGPFTKAHSLDNPETTKDHEIKVIEGKEMTVYIDQDGKKTYADILKGHFDKGISASSTELSSLEHSHYLETREIPETSDTWSDEGINNQKPKEFLEAETPMTDVYAKQKDHSVIEAATEIASHVTECIIQESQTDLKSLSKKKINTTEQFSELSTVNGNALPQVCQEEPPKDIEELKLVSTPPPLSPGDTKMETTTDLLKTQSQPESESTVMAESFPQEEKIIFMEENQQLNYFEENSREEEKMKNVPVEIEEKSPPLHSAIPLTNEQTKIFREKSAQNQPESLSEEDHARYSYAQILAMGLQSLPGSMTTSLDAIKSMINSGKVSKTKTSDVRYRSKSSETYYPHQERSRDKERGDAKQPVIEVTLAAETDAKAKTSGHYIPGLLFTDGSERRSRSKSERRKSHKTASPLREEGKQLLSVETEIQKVSQTQTRKDEPLKKDRSTSRRRRTSTSRRKKANCHKRKSTPTSRDNDPLHHESQNEKAEEEERNDSENVFITDFIRDESPDITDEKDEPSFKVDDGEHVKVLSVTEKMDESSEEEISVASTASTKHSSKHGQKKKKKKRPRETKNKEDELEKALREIAEMERSGQIPPLTQRTPKKSDDIETKKNKRRETEHKQIQEETKKDSKKVDAKSTTKTPPQKDVKSPPKETKHQRSDTEKSTLKETSKLKEPLKFEEKKVKDTQNEKKDFSGSDSKSGVKKDNAAKHHKSKSHSDQKDVKKTKHVAEDTKYLKASEIPKEKTLVTEQMDFEPSKDIEKDNSIVKTENQESLLQFTDEESKSIDEDSRTIQCEKVAEIEMQHDDDEWVDLEKDEEIMNLIESERKADFSMVEIGMSTMKRDDETEEALKPHFNKPDLKFDQGGSQEAIKIYGPNNSQIIPLEGARNVFSQGNSNIEENAHLEVEVGEEGLKMVGLSDLQEITQERKSPETSQHTKNDPPLNLMTFKDENISYTPKTNEDSDFTPSAEMAHWINVMEATGIKTVDTVDNIDTPVDHENIDENTHEKKSEEVDNKLKELGQQPEIKIEEILKITGSTSFNLPIPDHACDWMEVIEEGGFTFDSDESDNEENLYDEKHEEKEIDKTDGKELLKEKTKEHAEISDKIDVHSSFNLPIPEHACDWMEVIEEGGFTLDSDDDNECPETEPITLKKNKETLEKSSDAEEVKPAKEMISEAKTDVSSVKDKSFTFNLPIPDHAEDWIEVIEGGGFTIDSEEEDETSGQKDKSDHIDIEKTPHNYVKEDSKPQVYNLPIPEHANDWMDVIKDGGFTLDDEDDDQISLDHGSGKPDDDAKEENKKLHQPFTLVIPEHASDWIEVIKDGGFTLDSEDEEVDKIKSDSQKENILENEAENEAPKLFNFPILKDTNDQVETRESENFIPGDGGENIISFLKEPSKDKSGLAHPKEENLVQPLDVKEISHVINEPKNLDSFNQRIKQEDNFASVIVELPSDQKTTQLEQPEEYKNIITHTEMATVKVYSNEDSTAQSGHIPQTFSLKSSLDPDTADDVVLKPQWMRKLPFELKDTNKFTPKNREEDVPSEDKESNVCSLTEAQVEGAIFGSVKERKFRPEVASLIEPSYMTEVTQPNQVSMFQDDYYKNKKKRPKKIRDKDDKAESDINIPSDEFKRETDNDQTQVVEETSEFSTDDGISRALGTLDITDENLIAENQADMDLDSDIKHCKLQEHSSDDMWNQVIKDSEEFSRKYHIKSDHQLNPLPDLEDSKLPTHESYASIVTKPTISTHEELEEPKKPYKYRNPPTFKIETDEESSSFSKVSEPCVDEEGFIEYLSKKEKHRRKTHSTSEPSKELEEEIKEALLKAHQEDPVNREIDYATEYPSCFSVLKQDVEDPFEDEESLHPHSLKKENIEKAIKQGNLSLSHQSTIAPSMQEDNIHSSQKNNAHSFYIDDSTLFAAFYIGTDLWYDVFGIRDAEQNYYLLPYDKKPTTKEIDTKANKSREEIISQDAAVLKEETVIPKDRVFSQELHKAKIQDERIVFVDKKDKDLNYENKDKHTKEKEKGVKEKKEDISLKPLDLDVQKDRDIKGYMDLLEAKDNEAKFDVQSDKVAKKEDTQKERDINEYLNFLNEQTKLNQTRDDRKTATFSKEIKKQAQVSPSKEEINDQKVNVELQKENDVKEYLTFLDKHSEGKLSQVDSQLFLKTDIMSYLPPVPSQAVKVEQESSLQPSSKVQKEKDITEYLVFLDEQTKGTVTRFDNSNHSLMFNVANYDLAAIHEAETKHQELLAQEHKMSYSQALLTPVPQIENSEEEEDDKLQKGFIMLKTKTVQVVVKENKKPMMPPGVLGHEDSEGFKEFVSKHERRRRLRSSCSEGEDDSIKDLVLYTPRVELPEPFDSEETTVHEGIKTEVIEEEEENGERVAKKEIAPSRHRRRTLSHRKRNRSRVSEAEKELEDVLQTISREETLEKYGLLESFWHNKFECEESEANFYRLLAQGILDSKFKGSDEQTYIEAAKESESTPIVTSQAYEGGIDFSSITITKANNLPLLNNASPFNEISDTTNTSKSVGDIDFQTQCNRKPDTNNEELTKSPKEMPQTVSLNPKNEISSTDENKSPEDVGTTRLYQKVNDELQETQDPKIKLDETCVALSPYDIISIQQAERDYYELMAKEGKLSYAEVASHPVPVHAEPDEEKEEKGFIMLYKKNVQVIVRGETPERTHPISPMDEEGFVEYVSKQEKRRRLRSSCSEDDDVKDLVPYIPRMELAEVEVVQEPIDEEVVRQEIKESDQDEGLLQTDEDGEKADGQRRKRRTSHRRRNKSSRSSKLSEVEEEINEIIRSLERDEILAEHSLRDSFCFDVWLCADAETRYYEMMSLQAKKVPEALSFTSNDDNDDDTDKHDPPRHDPPSPPQPPPSSSPGQQAPPKFLYNIPFLPNWSDESTYLSINPPLSSPPTLPLHHAYTTDSSSHLPSHFETLNTIPKVYDKGSIKTDGTPVLQNSFSSKAEETRQKFQINVCELPTSKLRTVR